MTREVAEDRRARSIRRVSWGILSAAACWSFLHVCRLAVDVPVEDDWDYLAAAENFGWNALFAVHVQHRIVFTRLLFVLSHRLDGLNFVHLLVAQYAIYLGLVGAMLWLFREELRKVPYFPLFFLPFFSDLPQVNLLWAGQSQFHFMLLFTVLALRFGFRERATGGTLCGFVFCLIFSIFSMSPLPAALILMLWIARQGLLLRRAPSPERAEILRNTLLAAASVGAAVGLFFLNYAPNLSGGSPPLKMLPVFVAGSLARGFALIQPYNIGSSLLCIAIGVLFLLPAFRLGAALLRDFRTALTENGAALALLLWGILLCVAIPFSRGGVIDDRHLEALLPAIPAAGSLLLGLPSPAAPDSRRRAALEYLICVLIALSFSFSFRLSSELSAHRTEGAETLRRWAKTPERTLEIPALYPAEFSAPARRGLRLRLNCFRDSASSRL